MPQIRILTERELRRCVALDLGAVEVISGAFKALAEGKVSMPPILRLDIPEHNGEVDVKTAYVQGLDGFAMKISPGFFDNPKKGLPSTSGLIVVHSAYTGFVEAVLLDNGYLTDVRTAAAGAVAAQHLAPDGPVRAAVLGAGIQARLQMQALALVRPLESVRVWARDPAKARRYAEQMTDELGVPVQVTAEAETAVRESSVVVAATPARKPILKAGWLHPGLHITCMGSDSEDKNELDPVAVAQADRFVCDRRSQSARLGELHHALASGAVAQDFLAPELGEIVIGKEPGRRTADEVTICDLTGTGVQDTAIALYAIRRAAEAGMGTMVET